MLQRILPVLLCIISLTSSAQVSLPETETITWSASRKLKWSDYKASPNPDSDAAASTTTYLSIEYAIRPNSFSFRIRSLFAMNESWGRHKDAYILSHEQGHFDIAEIFARKLNKRMSEYKFNPRSYQRDLKRIYEQVTRETEDLQNLYDKETNHSINKAKQAEWLLRIEAMLEEWEAWANY